MTKARIKSILHLQRWFPLLSVVWFLFFSLIVYPADAGEPGKQETIEYLNTKLQRFYRVQCTVVYASLNQWVDSISVSNSGGIRINLRDADHWTDGKEVKREGTYSAPLHRFDANSIKIKQSDQPTKCDSIEVCVWCQDNDSCVKENSVVYVNDNHDGTYNFEWNKLCLYFGRKNSIEVERVAKGLRHAIKLYGGRGTRELFD